MDEFGVGAVLQGGLLLVINELQCLLFPRIHTHTAASDQLF